MLPLKTRARNHSCFPHLLEMALAAPGQESEEGAEQHKQIIRTSTSSRPASYEFTVTKKNWDFAQCFKSLCKNHKHFSMLFEQKNMHEQTTKPGMDFAFIICLSYLYKPCLPPSLKLSKGTSFRLGPLEDMLLALVTPPYTQLWGSMV